MDRVLGHDDAKERFRRTLATGRLASTYLFVGPAGVGKRLFAERLAVALLCPRHDPISLTGCRDCESCRLAESGGHPDLLRVARPEGKTTLPIDLFLGPADKRYREGLCHDLSLRPMISDRRVAIIDDADHFSVEAANCLLKTLEEPPPRSLLILVGTSPARQLATIRSRSQVIRFRPLTEDQVAQALSRPPHEFEADEAARLAAQSSGSPGRALEIAEGALEEACSALLACLTTPVIDANRFAKVVEDQSKAVGTEPRVRRRALNEMFGAAIGYYHGVLLAEPAFPDRPLRSLEACLEAEEQLSRNANQSAVVRVLAERLASV